MVQKTFLAARVSSGYFGSDAICIFIPSYGTELRRWCTVYFGE